MPALERLPDESVGRLKDLWLLKTAVETMLASLPTVERECLTDFLDGVGFVATAKRLQLTKMMVKLTRERAAVKFYKMMYLRPTSGLPLELPEDQ